PGRADAGRLVCTQAHLRSGGDRQGAGAVAAPSAPLAAIHSSAGRRTYVYAYPNLLTCIAAGARAARGRGRLRWRRQLLNGGSLRFCYGVAMPRRDAVRNHARLIEIGLVVLADLGLDAQPG